MKSLKQQKGVILKTRVFTKVLYYIHVHTNMVSCFVSNTEKIHDTKIQSRLVVVVQKLKKKKKKI